MQKRDKLGKFFGGHWREERLYWNKDWLFTEYIVKEKSSSEIALEMDCSVSNIKYWINKHNIPITGRRSKKTRLEMRKRQLGQKSTEETKEKMSISQLERWSKISIEDRKLSEEMKKQISETNKNKGIRPKVRFCESGDKHPNWLGGVSFEPYGLDFNTQLKLQIKERDKNVCQICGYNQNDLDQIFHIHHIDYNKQNNNSNNLILLCNSCHSKTNYNRKKWIKYFKNKLGGK